MNTKKQILRFALFSLTINSLYAFLNFGLGIHSKSYWFLTMGAYHFIFAFMRFSVMLCNRQDQKEVWGQFIQKITGFLIILLALILSLTVYLSVRYDVAQNFNEIIMITIATYTFTKITISIINFLKRNNFNSHIISSLRSISLCDAAASIYSMQKSMLVSFEGMSQADIKLMNLLTGTGLVIVVGVLGVIMIKNSKKEIKNG